MRGASGSKLSGFLSGVNGFSRGERFLSGVNGERFLGVNGFSG